MAEIIKRIEADVAQFNTFPAIVAKQGDKSTRSLEVQFLNEGEKLTIETGATITINAERSDGESKSFEGSVNADGTVNVPITAWMLDKDGPVSCSVSVIRNGGRLTTTKFMITVEAAENAGDDISQDEADLFMRLFTDASNATASANTAAQQANTATENANEATQEAINAAQQAASAVLAGGFLPIYNQDENKNYTWQIVIRNGYPVLTMTEITE